MNRSKRKSGSVPHHGGFSLVELMAAGLIGSMLLTGLVQVAAGARSSFALQEAIAELQESARFAHASVGGILRQSGFVPEPWLGSAVPVGPAEGTVDAATAAGDRIVLRTWSDRNCFDALNPALDAAGRPAFHLKEIVLELNASDNLALTCRYGADAATWINQIQRQGLLPGVEAFQALWAEDLDADGGADRWVRGGAWSDPAAVIGIQVGLLIASTEPAGEQVSRTLNVLDHVVTSPADGKLRRVVTTSHAFRGKR